MISRKCDSCERFTMSADLTVEECTAWHDMILTPAYIDERINGNEMKCAGYKKFKI